MYLIINIHFVWRIFIGTCLHATQQDEPHRKKLDVVTVSNLYYVDLAFEFRSGRRPNCEHILDYLTLSIRSPDSFK
jgi:hypothetical protein